MSSKLIEYTDTQSATAAYLAANAIGRNIDELHAQARRFSNQLPRKRGRVDILRSPGSRLDLSQLTFKYMNTYNPRQVLDAARPYLSCIDATLGGVMGIFVLLIFFVWLLVALLALLCKPGCFTR